MINLLTANIQKKGRYCRGNVETLLKAQIENSLEIGWKISKIFIVANFNFEYMKVKAFKTNLNSSCLTGSKMFGIQWIMNLGFDDNIIWSHDLDAWQNCWFTPPDIRDVGITTYSTSKLNGGSIFWSKNVKDIIDSIVDKLKINQNKEEPTLNALLKNKYKDRVTIINNTYNVGCSGFCVRMIKAEKPIKVCHLNPTNRIAWETHNLDRNGFGIRSVSPRLEKLLRKYFTLANELSEEGKKRQKELREENLKKLSKLAPVYL